MGIEIEYPSDTLIRWIVYFGTPALTFDYWHLLLLQKMHYSILAISLINVPNISALSGYLKNFFGNVLCSSPGKPFWCLGGPFRITVRALRRCYCGGGAQVNFG